jgi:hypothetical protein
VTATDDRRSDGYEPRFDIDYAYGLQGELFVTRIIDALQTQRVQVKRDGQVGETGNLYVEFEHDPGRRGKYTPSGLHEPDGADLWVFVFGDAPSCLVVSSELLRAQVKLPSIKIASQTKGSCPTRGYLVPVQGLVYSIRALARGMAT